MEEISERLINGASGWGATGKVGAFGFIGAVDVKPKIEAALRQSRIEHLLAPWQKGASQKQVDEMAREISPPESAVSSVGYAADLHRLMSHRCWHMAQALLTATGFLTRRQLLWSAAITTLTIGMATAFNDLRCIFDPPPIPEVTFPSGRAPGQVFWVSLNTDRPRCFCVLLDSGYWAHRQADVEFQGGRTPSNRAELRLLPRLPQESDDERSGSIMVQRQRRFLSRGFLGAEVVGEYSLSYVQGLGRPRP
jgi:hypothetical protein